MRRVLTNILVGASVLTSLAAAPRPNYPGSSKAPTDALPRDQVATLKPYQTGTASWYGKPFQGKTTASGEAYNMFQFTAAHRRLPMGTVLRVTNLQNGSSVIVRVNDRGPVPRSRIIDLSYAAAKVLDLRQCGLGRVRLDVIEFPAEVAVSTGMP